MSDPHERKEVLPDPDDRSIGNGDFVDAVAWLVGRTRCDELVKRVGGSRKALVQEAKRLLQKDSAAGKDESAAGQSFA